MNNDTFNEKVYNAVKIIPKGKVASYGQIAALVDSPRSARAVGWAMHQMDSLPPKEFKQYAWWRVINSQGFISTTCAEHTYELQKKLLEKDGIEVTWHDKQQMYHIDMKKYLWTP